MARPARTDEPISTNFYLSREARELLDSAVASLSTPGTVVTRSGILEQAIREWIRRHLKHLAVSS